jgi:hypothetical protein
VHEVTLVPLLRKARQYNQQVNLSGLLVHTNGQFLQVLEGPEPALSNLFARIIDDPRHYDVHTLAYGPVAERAFADWRMAYAPANEAFFERITGFLPLATTPSLTAHPSAEVVQLLRGFMSGAAQDK